MKKTFSYITLLLLSLGIVPLSTTHAADQTSGYDNLFANAPDWFSRIHGEAGYGSDTNPHFALQTTQPIWQADTLTHTVFGQGRVSWRNGKWTTNFGTGYRFLNEDASWLFGGNAFYDTQLNDGHKRIGLGAEAMQPYMTFRANYYKGISDWKKIKTGTNYYVEERALSGYDLGMDAPVPYLPWARLFASFYNWDATQSDDIYGAETKIRADLTPYLSMDFGGSADNADYAVFTKLRFALGSPSTEQKNLLTEKLSPSAFQRRDLKKHLLDPVERHNDIATERRTVATGSVTGVRIVVRRGS